MVVIDGINLRDKVLNQLKDQIVIQKLKPHLVIVQVGDDEASNRYIRQKISAGEKIGAQIELIRLPQNVSQSEIENKIVELNHNKLVHGIIVQLPLPKTLDQKKLIQAIQPQKDVDGLTKDSPFKPATPLGIMEILHEYKVETAGKTAVVLGQSDLVGAPLSLMLEDAGTKVIRIDIDTPEDQVKNLVLQGDIVVSAVGKINLVTENMVKTGAVVIDVGTNVNAEGKLAGDVDFENVKGKVSLITPVPGGVGPMTVAMLMKNLVKSASIDNQSPKQ